MRKHILLSLAVLLAGGAGGRLAAQQRDSMRAPSDTAEAGRLRAEIEQRFNDRVKQELNLNADQATKLRDTQERFGTRRRAVTGHEAARHTGALRHAPARGDATAGGAPARARRPDATRHSGECGQREQAYGRDARRASRDGQD